MSSLTLYGLSDEQPTPMYSAHGNRRLHEEWSDLVEVHRID